MYYPAMANLRNPPRWLLYLRSSLFLLCLVIISTTHSLLFLAGAVLPFHRRYRIARQWGRLNVRALRWLCRITVAVEGAEHIPTRPSIIFAKHQSTYEILVLMALLGPSAWVAKREILRIPVFGWAFGRSKPITIDRKAGRSAIEQLVQQGGQALEDGRHVMIFPEGTRTAAGSPPNYRIGGPMLAARTGYPVVPVAHNAGEFWPRHSLLKWPGTVTLVFGPSIETAGKTAEQIRDEAREWIEGEMKRISDPARWNRR